MQNCNFYKERFLSFNSYLEFVGCLDDKFDSYNDISRHCLFGESNYKKKSWKRTAKTSSDAVHAPDSEDDILRKDKADF